MPTFQVSFLRSASALDHLPGDPTPEVAILGRSNVGKSSLLNSLAGQHQLAQTSRTPGRTRLLNLFAVNPASRHPLRLVDCPGYGYAKVAREERLGWNALIEPYLSERENLRLCLLLVDSMLPPQASDLDTYAWLGRHRATLVVATKWDRLSGNQRPLARRRLAGSYGEDFLPFSSVTAEGHHALRNRLLATAQVD